MKEELELKNTRLLQFIVEDRHSGLRHALLLAMMLVVIFLSNWQYGYSGPVKYYRIVCVFIGLVTMCYVNMFILVPLFFFKGRYILYLTLLSALVMLCLALMSNLLNTFFSLTDLQSRYVHVEGGRGIYEGFIILLPIVLMTTMIKLFQRWTIDNQRIAELKHISLRMELNELKNQINPHFLFNMLNGIKALVRTDAEKATQVIMKLSDLLRYQLYEDSEERTSLCTEVAFLSNFLNLEMIRRDRLVLEIDTVGIVDEMARINIPPGLFTVFVENAVKHSVNINGGESRITVRFAMADGRLQFRCINSKDPDFNARDQKNSGLGLVNIRRRLDLIYLQQHQLKVEDEELQFKITLNIPL